MKVLFVWSDADTAFPPTSIHIGIAYLSAALKEANHDTALLRLNDVIDREEFHRQLEEKGKPDLVGFTLTTNQFDYDKDLVKWLREKWPDVPVLFGGHHPSLAPEEVIAVPDVDFVCRGEAEDALVELADRLEQGLPCDEIANMWVKKENGEIIRNEIRPLDPDIDKLPFMDLALFEPEKMFEEGKMEMFVMAGRGCPFHCTYCCNPAIVRLYKGKGRVVRKRSIGRVMEELKYHIKNHPTTTHIMFWDETFTLKKEWLMDFCRQYKKEIGLPFSFETRVTTFDEEMVKAVAEAGCSGVHFGVETGNEWLRKEVLNRRMSNDDILRAFRLCDKYGIRTCSMAMIGLPYETPEMAQETIDFLMELAPNHARFSIFYPFPGTELYELCEREGFLTGERSMSYFHTSVLSMPNFSREKIVEMNREGNKKLLFCAAEKETYGYYDFLVRFADAEIDTPQEDMVQITQFFDAHPRRFVIQAHPPSKLTYRNIKLPEDKDMDVDFDISMAPGTYDQEGGKVKFEIKVNGKNVFKKVLDPKRREKDRNWHDFRVSLKKFRGKTVDISFVTSASDNRYCTAGWGRPVVIACDEKPNINRPKI